MPTLLLFYEHLQLTNGKANLYPKAVRCTLQNPSSPKRQSPKQVGKCCLQFPAHCVPTRRLKKAHQHVKRSKASTTASVGFFMFSNPCFTADNASLAASLLCRNATLKPKTWSIRMEKIGTICEHVKLIKTLKQTANSKPIPVYNCTSSFKP